MGVGTGDGRCVGRAVGLSGSSMVGATLGRIVGDDVGTDVGRNVIVGAGVGAGTRFRSCQATLSTPSVESDAVTTSKSASPSMSTPKTDVNQISKKVSSERLDQAKKEIGLAKMTCKAWKGTIQVYSKLLAENKTPKTKTPKTDGKGSTKKD